MEYFVTALREHPELAIFLTLAVGFFIGRVKIGWFSLGTVVGTLLAGVLIGQLDIQVPALVKSGLLRPVPVHHRLQGRAPVLPRPEEGRPAATGPHGRAVRTCLLSRVRPAKLLGYDVGTAAGLLAGAFTESTVIGTAADAINRLDISAAEKTALVNNIPVAYAVTYLIGTAFIVWFLPNIGPRLMRRQSEGGSQEAPGAGVGRRRAGARRAVRAREVRGPGLPRDQRALVNRTIGELEALPRDQRVFVVRVRQKARSSSPTPGRRSPGGRCRRHDARRAPDGAGDRDRSRGETTRSCSTSGGGAGRGRHQQGRRREDAREHAAEQYRARGLSRQARAAPGGDAVRARHRD